MSRYLKQYEKEHMKMAMLRQEETFKKQVQELHRLYRVQKLLMTTDAANAVTSVRSYKPEDERHRRENEAGSSKSWDAYSDRRKASPLVLEETDLDLTLAIGSFATAEKKAASSSVGSRTSISSSSTESGSPDCRLPPPRPVNATGPNVGQHMEQEGLKQPPWLPKCPEFGTMR